ncbi:MAG: hypothetical protein JSV19_04605 [Phycisphaerales bacterium]|nr:MAG: hypothetical protein JSV19_04605 [Phycisphaerales bacterium]
MFPRLLPLVLAVGLYAVIDATAPDRSCYGWQDAPPEESLRQLIDQLEAVKSDIPLEDPFLEPAFAADIDFARDMLALVQQAREQLPVDASLRAALRPMAEGRFREALDRLGDYAETKPRDLVACFSLSLCEIELGNFRAAHGTLDRAFPEDEAYPVVRLLKEFTDRLAAHASKPTAGQICDAYALAYDTVRRALREKDPDAVYLFSEPLLLDMLLLRFLTLGEKHGDPLYLSPEAIVDAVVTVESPWVPVAARLLFRLDHTDTEQERDVDGAAAPSRIFALLSAWYGEDERYRSDDRTRVPALRALQKLDPDNGAWKLLEIRFDDTIVDEEQFLYAPLSPTELEIFFAAFGKKTIRLEYAELDQTAMRIVRATRFPWLRPFETRMVAWPNAYGHLRNIVYRAKSTALSAAAQGDRDLALRIANSFLKLSEFIRQQDLWSALRTELMADSYASLGQKLLARIHTHDPEQAAFHLRALAELDLRQAAVREAEHGGLCLYLPLPMLETAMRAQSTPAAWRRRAAVRLREDPEQVRSLRRQFSREYFAPWLFADVVIAHQCEVVPTLLEHLGRYEFDYAWRAIWTLGKLRDQRAQAKLKELCESEDPRLAAMARWSQSQLAQP